MQEFIAVSPHRGVAKNWKEFLHDRTPHLNQVNGGKSNHPRMWSCEDPFHSITNGGNLWKSRFSELSTSNYFLSLKQELPFGLILLPLSFLVQFLGFLSKFFGISRWTKTWASFIREMFPLQGQSWTTLSCTDDGGGQSMHWNVSFKKHLFIHYIHLFVC